MVEFFGFYNISVLIITDGIIGRREKISNKYYQQSYESIIKHEVYACLQRHGKRPTVVFGIEDLKRCKYLGSWTSNLGEIMRKGRYLQKSNSGYVLELFSPDASEWNPDFGVYEDAGEFYHKLDHEKRELLYIDFPIVKKGEYLHHEEEIIKRMLFNDGRSYSIGLYMYSNT